MELFGLITLIAIVTFLIFWRRSINRVAAYSEKFIVVSTKRGELELTREANEIATQLNDIGDIRVEDLDDLFASKRMNKSTTKEKK